MIAIPVYVRDQKNYELLMKCIKSISHEDILLVVNEFKLDGIGWFDSILSECHEGIENTTYKSIFRDVNSVAGAWNDAIECADSINRDYLIIINQDVKMIKGEFDLIESVTTHGIAAAKTPEGEPDFALFAVNPKFIKERFGTLRPFDEGFEGAYFEDNDFRYQCKLKGIEIKTVDVDFEHYGSGVLKHDKEAERENELRFKRNHIRYIKKWGGVRGLEKFKTPFNK